MKKLLAICAIVAPAALHAGQVEIVAVDASPGSSGWRFDVTLRHADTGWDHYADGWEVRGPDGAVLGNRVLFHPHVNEQPFTRSLSGVAIPEETAHVTVHAHDKVHGWAPEFETVTLAD